MNLYIKETGSENPETIIFIHSENTASWMWDGQVKAFQDYHCIVPDLPEHGNSKDVRPFSIKYAAELIIDLVKDKAHGGKAHMVGMSLGAQIALQVLNKAPEIVDHSLISGMLVNTIPPTETFLKHLNDIIEQYVPVKNDNLSIGSYIRSYNIPKNLIKKFKESTYIISSDSAERIIRENILFKIPSNLENAYVPVLVMAGEKDFKAIKESTRELDHILPNSIVYLVPGVGHLWNMESLKLFNLALRCWINGNALPDSLRKF